MMNTLRTYNLMLLCFFLLAPSNISKAALLGTNITALNSSWPWSKREERMRWIKRRLKDEEMKNNIKESERYYIQNGAR